VGRIRIDDRGNCIFPHFDESDVLCGFEKKNAGFAGFASGGIKGLWKSHGCPDDSRLVICESAIDALSYAYLFPDSHARYLSTGGAISELQRDLIRDVIAKMSANSEIVAAMDSDESGRKLAGVLREAFDRAARLDLQFRDHVPACKDWNDQLRFKEDDRIARKV
jgi:hypothetical protein